MTDPATALAEAMSLGRGEALYPTCDDWLPSFDAPPDGRGGFVGIRVWPRCVRTGGAMVPTGEYAVTAYGVTSTSLSREGLSLDEARAIVRRLPSVVSMDYLRAIGFRAR